MRFEPPANRYLSQVVSVAVIGSKCVMVCQRARADPMAGVWRPPLFGLAKMAAFVPGQKNELRADFVHRYHLSFPGRK